jgi:hypothetical protein
VDGARGLIGLFVIRGLAQFTGQYALSQHHQ